MKLYENDFNVADFTGDVTVLHVPMHIERELWELLETEMLAADIVPTLDGMCYIELELCPEKREMLKSVFFRCMFDTDVLNAN